MSIRKDQTFGQDGEIISENIQAVGVYLSLRDGVVGYSEAADSAPSSVEITLNGTVETVSMNEYPNAPSIDVAELSLPTERPVKASVQGVTEHVYRASMLLDGVDRSHEVGGGYDVILTDEAHLRMRQHSSSLANAFNAGAAWSDIQAIIPGSVSNRVIKQDLVGFVKKRFSEMGTVPQGFVVSHDTGTTRGLWRADVDTTAEPTKDSADWTLVFEITV
jgi:hypothetical protein